jgi:hypothetical protein
MSLNKHRVCGILAISAGALALVAWLLWPRPSIARVDIISQDTACPEVAVRGQNPATFLERGFAPHTKSLGLPDPAQRLFLKEITRYIAASIAGCETNVLEFRQGSGFDERTMAVAHRVAQAIPVEQRPDSGVLSSDAEMAL